MNDHSVASNAGRRRWLAGVGGAVALATLPRGAGAATAARPRAVVVVMLRGAVDGLSVVAPVGDVEYARSRPDIAIGPIGAEGGALALDGPFGLHPALAPLMPLWRAGRMAFVHASGSPDPTRSHFDAQDFMETATPGRRSTPEGWLNRLLVASAPDGGTAVRGVSLGPSMPRILAGGAQVAALSSQGAGASSAVTASPTLAAALERTWGADPAASGSWAALRESSRVMASAEEGSMAGGMEAGIAPGAVALAALARDAARLGRVLRREPMLSVASFSVGGWDTHANQGSANGALATRLAGLAGGLDALIRALDDRLDDTVILVMSEFGRTVRQNGTRGTDHGHGNAMWLIGAGVQGGRVHGRWPGLETAALHEGRDLAVTTDYRQVIAQVLERHMGLDDRRLQAVLPEGAGMAAELDLLRG